MTLPIFPTLSPPLPSPLPHTFRPSHTPPLSSVTLAGSPVHSPDPHQENPSDNRGRPEEESRLQDEPESNFHHTLSGCSLCHLCHSKGLRTAALFRSVIRICWHETISSFAKRDFLNSDNFLFLFFFFFFFFFFL